MQGRTPIILGKSDFETLKRYLRRPASYRMEGHCLLSYELDQAIVVDDVLLPRHCVRLNCRVKVKELPSNRVHQFSIVLPEQKDPKNNKISVLEPWGASFIGLSKTERIERQINGDSICFEILDVMPVAHI
ncbi:GreA/GreB family elongation factor [Dyadobacter jiangsuensis]